MSGIVDIQPVKDAETPIFHFVVSSDYATTESESDVLDLFSGLGSDDGESDSQEDTIARSLSELVAVLKSGGMTPEARAITADIRHIKRVTPWGGQQTFGAFLLGDWIVVRGSYGLMVSRALHEAATEFLELAGEHSVVAGRLVDDIPSLAQLGDALRAAGATQTPTLISRLGSSSGSVLAITDNAAKALEEGFSTLPVYPSGRKLKPHQEQAVLSLAYTCGGLLADQVGLGKGGEFTCAWESTKDYLQRVENREDVGPCVVSVTKSMVGEIAHEITLWAGEDAKVVVLSGTKKQDVPPDVDYVVLNHDILAKRLDELKEMKPSAFIADEAHVFKTMTAKRSKAAVELSRHIRALDEDAFICMATGTPFLNRPSELWGILSVLGVESAFAEVAKKFLPRKVEYWRKDRYGKAYSQVGPISEQRAFEIFFCNGRYDRFKNWRADGATHTDLLHELLVTNAGMVRRRKSDVINPLPPVIENIINVELPPEVSYRYDVAQKQFAQYYVDKAQAIALAEGVPMHRALELATKKLLSSQTVMQLGELRVITSEGKGEAVVRWIDDFLSGAQIVPHLNSPNGPVSDDDTRKKLIVFTHYRAVRDYILNHPDVTKYNPVTILPGGEQSDASIAKHKKRFQEDPGCRLMVCSMAAREGHTLTAAKDILVVDIPYVPSWVVQIAGRCWARMSELYEPHEATIHYMVANGTIDAKVVSSVRAKKKVFDAVIDNEGADDIGGSDEETPESLLQNIISGFVSFGIAK